MYLLSETFMQNCGLGGDRIQAQESELVSEIPKCSLRRRPLHKEQTPCEEMPRRRQMLVRQFIL